MKRSYRVFSVVALSGLCLLFLASAPARAQYPLIATAPGLVADLNSYSYMPAGMNLNQATYLNSMQAAYGSLYTNYPSPRYMTNPSVYFSGPYSSGLLYNPYGFPYTYNPVIAPLP
jgi:hypothetical protein